MNLLRWRRQQQPQPVPDLDALALLAEDVPLDLDDDTHGDWHNGTPLGCSAWWEHITDEPN